MKYALLVAAFAAFASVQLGSDNSSIKGAQSAFASRAAVIDAAAGM